jgi:hypothetical protein
MAKTRSLPVHAPDSSRRMGRRQAVRALVAGAGAGVAIPGLAAGHPLAEHAHHPERIADAQEPAQEPRVTLRDQFDLLKGWVVGAYSTSEVSLRELGWDGPAFADEFPGCPHPDGHR